MASKINLKSANFWSLLTAVSSAILSFLTAGLAVKLLPAADAGLILITGSIISMIDAIGGLGIREATIRRLSRLFIEGNLDDVELIFSSSVFVVIGLYGSICICGYFFSSTIISLVSYPDLETGRLFIGLMLLVLFAQQLAAQLTMTFQTAQRYRLSSMHSMTINGMTVVGSYVALIVSESMLVLAIVRAVFVVLFLSYLLLDPFGIRPCRMRVLFSLKESLSMLAYGKSILASKIVALSINGLDRVLFVGAFGLNMLPIYALPRRMFEVAHRLLCQQSSYLFPVMSSGGKMTSFRFFEKVRWEYSCIGALMYSGMACFGSSVLALMVDSVFAEEAGRYVLAFSIVGFIQSFEIVLMPYAKAIGRPHFNFYAKSVASVAIVVPMYCYSKYTDSIDLFTSAQVGIVFSPVLLSLMLFGRRRSLRILTEMIKSPVGVCSASFVLMFFIDECYGLRMALVLKSLVFVSVVLVTAVLEVYVIKNPRAVKCLDTLIGSLRSNVKAVMN
tara:strand:- start:1958 stop:3466 length:1509 start_codon:yes stop_codon:yes gene_type:complete